MESKARDNMNAAQLLTINGLYDSSASRAYYAAYLAAWYHLSNIGIQPGHKTQKGCYYWRHDLFPELLCDEYKLVGPLQMEKFELLYSRRIKADYYIDRVEKEEAANSIQLVLNCINTEVVIPAVRKRESSEKPGFRIKSGMTKISFIYAT